MDSSADFVGVLVSLAEAQVEFIVVGGVAAVAHGAPITTFDVDIVHRRSPKNVERLTTALQTLNAHTRSRPGLFPGPDALAGPGHQLLETRLGPLDVLGVIEDNRGYDELLSETSITRVRGYEVRLLSLDTLIAIKRGSSREKDRLMLPLLEEAARVSKR